MKNVLFFLSLLCAFQANAGFFSFCTNEDGKPIIRVHWERLIGESSWYQKKYECCACTPANECGHPTLKVGRLSQKNQQGEQVEKYILFVEYKKDRLPLGFEDTDDSLPCLSIALQRLEDEFENLTDLEEQTENTMKQKALRHVIEWNKLVKQQQGL